MASYACNQKQWWCTQAAAAWTNAMEENIPLVLTTWTISQGLRRQIHNNTYKGVRVSGKVSCHSTCLYLR